MPGLLRAQMNRLYRTLRGNRASGDTVLALQRAGYKFVEKVNGNSINVTLCNLSMALKKLKYMFNTLI